jgi:beta-N-acetylhexosaminidase
MSRARILGTLLPGFSGTELPGWVERMLGEGLAGVCLFGENVVSLPQLRSLIEAVVAANPHAVIAIDEEGGDVTRLHYDVGSPYPGNAVLGRLDSLDATEAVGQAVGAALRSVGVNLDFAPDVDVNSNSLNPVIGVRSFGAETELVARHGAAWTAGLQSQGVAACLKHFPGHGDTAQDSHLALPTVDVPVSVLRSRELVPFAAAIAAGAETVMTSHIVLPQLDATSPATFSQAVLEGVLRGELGFEGVIVSDALDMVGASGSIGIPAAAVRALVAGCDLLCIGTKNTEAQLEEIVARVEAALAAGELPAARLADAAERVAALAAAYPSSAAGSNRMEFSPADGSGWSVEATGPADSIEVRRTDAAEGRRESMEFAPAGGSGWSRDGVGSGDSIELRRARVRMSGVPGVAQVAASFGVTAAAAQALAAGAGRHWVLVRVETVANIAVGQVPWGPFAALVHEHPGLEVITVTEHEAGAAGNIPEGECVLVIGKDNERRPWVVDLLERLRRRHDTVVAVDMGWPGSDPRYAGIATYGASALLGDTLVAFLTQNGVIS